MISKVMIDGGVFIDMSERMRDSVELRGSMNGAPRGYILPSDAPDDVKDELVNLGFEIRRASPAVSQI